MAFLQTAFAVVGYLFKLFDGSGYEKEMKHRKLA